MRYASNCCSCFGKLIPPTRAIPACGRNLDRIDLVVDHRSAFTKSARDRDIARPDRRILGHLDLHLRQFRRRADHPLDRDAAAEIDRRRGQPRREIRAVNLHFARGARLQCRMVETQHHRVAAQARQRNIDADLVVAAGEPAARQLAAGCGRAS